MWHACGWVNVEEILQHFHKKDTQQFSWLGYLYAKLTGVGLNVCEHAEKAVLSHSSLVKKATFGFVDLASFC